jgi:hypothetical protein
MCIGNNRTSPYMDYDKTEQALQRPKDPDRNQRFSTAGSKRKLKKKQTTETCYYNLQETH